MKKIIAFLLSLLLIGMVTMASADTGVRTSQGATLTMDVSISGGGSVAKIGLKTNDAPVTFVSAVGGDVNDTVPPRGFSGSFVVVNLVGVSISPDGTTVSGSTDSYTVAALEAGTVGRLTFQVNEDAAFGTYTVEPYLISGDCTVSGSLTFTVSDRTPGDANEDGEADVMDALVIMQSITGQPVTYNAVNADCNGDGEVDMMDVLMIMQSIVGGIPLQ